MINKRFNTAGPIQPEYHYFLPKRLSHKKFNPLVEGMYYILLHAPRQSGKTTAVEEYANYLNNQGKYKALYVTLETARAAGNDTNQAVYYMLKATLYAIRRTFPEDTSAVSFIQDLVKQTPCPVDGMHDFLSFWAENSDRPVVLFLDEVDGLSDDPLMAILTQIRAGYRTRPRHFPQSIFFVGMRDLHDYVRRTSKESDESRLSPFNIVKMSLRLPDFTMKNIIALLSQHTKTTRQKFKPEAIEEIYRLTQGQPWLVNALADIVCFENVLDRSKPITRNDIMTAKNALVLRRETHLRVLLDRLKESRVRTIIDSVISGEERIRDLRDEDVEYVRDLGLLKLKGYIIANPIYQELIPRALTQSLQETIPNQLAWYLDSPPSLNMVRLLEGFSQFYRENAGFWASEIPYRESLPHLLLMAFLQRVVNGGGTIIREYALGRKRVDLFVTWKKQRFIIEVKVKRGSEALSSALKQTAKYMDTSHAEGHLIIFDREALQEGKAWEERVFHEVKTYDKKKIHLWCL